MTKAIATHLKTIFREISDIGFLLESDPKLPSVCGIITGETMRGSWWSHPQAQTIFQVNERLEDHPDITLTKLVSGKVTFVHRKFWPELVTIGSAQEPWQVKQLSPAAKALLKTVEKQGAVRSDQIGLLKGESGGKRTEVARELERKLLIHADQFHTESGAHAKLLETWASWCRRRPFEFQPISVDTAKRTFEDQLNELNARFGGNASLPWTNLQTKRSTKKKL